LKTTANFVRELIQQHSRNLHFRTLDASNVSAKLAEAEAIAFRFANKVEEISRSPHFTPAGRVDEARKAGLEAVAALQKWFAPLRDGLNRHEEVILGEMRAKVAPTPRSGDVGERMERAMLRQEIRSAALGLSEQGRAILYRTLDPGLREALTEIPVIAVNNGIARVEPYVSKEVVDECLLEAGAKALPEKNDLLLDIRQERELFSIIRNVVEKSVTDVAADVVLPEAVVR
jgi:hypothetical protein